MTNGVCIVPSLDVRRRIAQECAPTILRQRLLKTSKPRGFVSEMLFPRPRKGPNARSLCLTNVHFGRSGTFGPHALEAVLSPKTISTRATYDFQEKPADAIGRP
jgi:hypothetical protein